MSSNIASTKDRDLKNYTYKERALFFLHKLFTWRSLSILIILVVLISMFSWSAIEVFTKNDDVYVAKVDGKYITMNDFEVVLKRAKIALQQQGINNLNSEMKRHILKEEINRIVLAKEMKNIGFFMSDNDLIAHFVKKKDTLVDENGNFDTALVRRILKIYNLSEAEFFESMKQEIFVKKIFDIMQMSVSSQRKIAEKIASSRYQERVFDIIEVSNYKNMQKIERTSDQEIDDFYQAHKEHFTKPEMQKVKYIDSKKILESANIEVDNDEILRRYNQMYQNSEKEFKIALLVFDKKSEAEKIKSNIKMFKNSLLKVAQSLNRPKSEVILDKISLSELSPKIRSVISSLPLNKVSEVLSISDNKFAMIQVLSVKKGKSYSAAAVSKFKNDIANSIRREKECIFLNNTKKNIDRAISMQVSIDDIARSFNTTVLHSTVSKNDVLFNNDFNDVNNNSIRIIDSNSDENLNENCHFFVSHTFELIHAKAIPLKDVRLQINKEILADKKRKYIEQLSISIVSQLQNLGTNIAQIKQIVNSRGLKISRGLKLIRNDIDYSSTASGLESTLFTMNIGDVSGPFINQNDSYAKKGAYVVVILRKITDIALKNNEMENIIKSIQDDILQQKKHDIIELYINYLYKKYNVKLLNISSN